MSVGRDRIKALTDRWSYQRNMMIFAKDNIKEMEEGSVRRQAAEERLAARKAQLWPLVKQACEVSVQGAAEISALRGFIDHIELQGSLHEDRDIEMLEERMKSPFSVPSSSRNVIAFPTARLRAANANRRVTKKAKGGVA